MIYYRCNELHRHQYIRIRFEKTLVRSHCSDDQFTIVTNDPDQLSGSMNNLSRWQGPSIWGRKSMHMQSGSLGRPPPFINTRNCCRLSKPKASTLFSNLPNPKRWKCRWRHPKRALWFQSPVSVPLNDGLFLLSPRSLSRTPEIWQK